MAKKGFMIESRIMARQNDALNRTARATVNIDGGTLVALGNFEDGVFSATKATSGKGLWMAYNPSEHFTEIDGKFYPQLTADERDYTNLAGRPIDIFYPMAGIDLITLTDGNIKVGETVEVGKYLEQGANGFVVKATPTADTTSLKVIEIGQRTYPQAGIGNEYANAYLCLVVQN